MWERVRVKACAPVAGVFWKFFSWRCVWVWPRRGVRGLAVWVW